MIDTVTLKISNNNFKISTINKLDGYKKQKENGRYESTTRYCKSYHDYKKKKGEYFPVINVLKGTDSNGVEINSIEIQVSLPKLMFGTNLFEIDSSDLDSIYKKLIKNSAEIGIEITKGHLQSAIIKRIDFSKVIKLPEYLGTASQVIKKISGFDIKQSSKVNLKEYLCEGNKIKGISFKFLNTTQGYVIYSKFGEILKNGNTLIEKKIIEKINKDEYKDSVIKFEFSLHRKQSVEAMLKKFIKHKKANFNLSDVISDKTISKQILLEVFDKIFQPNYIALLSLSEMDENKLENYLKTQNLSFKSHALIHYLVKMTTKIGVGATFKELKERCNGSSYDRYKKNIKEILLKLDKIDPTLLNLIQYLREEHNKFILIQPIY